jgi:bacteriocin-like protein
MHQNDTLAARGEQLIELDEKALAAIVGGDGPIRKFLEAVGSLLWDCVSEGLDDVIDAAKEGYADAQT